MDSEVCNIYFFSFLLGGAIIFWQWEAMVTSYLSARVTSLPFYDLNGLVETSDFKIALMPGSYYVDIFRLSNDSLWQKAYQTRIEPNLESYKGHSDNMIYFPLTEKKTALYDNFYSIRFDRII